MRHLRASATAVLAVFAIVGCSDDPKAPTEPGIRAPEAASPAVRKGLTIPLAEDDFTGTVRMTTGSSLVITRFAVRNGELVAHGVLNGTLTNGTVVKNLQIRNIPATVSEAPSEVQQVAYVAGLVQQEEVCPILHLELGPIFLDLLGLQLETNEIVIDLRAVAGPGNLLGNLLCALVGLLDETPLNIGLINQILDLINNLLSQF